ncbi:TPA: acyltransferase [Escherichia coli]|nr:acyltransferase [Escherichia coli]HCJ9156485.1 acyltransferase [Escherichia coli]HCJ9659090.1 acyltransferase [Escherichia coli]HCJ9677445.1 acyltransferase [Escherichia coli]
MSNKTFRTDITGLRALAVVSVITYHFNHSYLPGGFVGVDVFFVISGFLMTSIIFSRIDDERFSLLGFYYDRVKRIIPALSIICLSVLIIGFLIAEPLTYQLIGKHAFSSILFFSNYTYMGESGYFDADAYSKYLLHTWSLSVEWQFYILYPLIIIGVRRFFSRRAAKSIILLLTIISFIYCVYQASASVEKAYYMTYARSWELLVGGLAYLYGFELIKKNAVIFEAIGVIAIIISFFLIDSNTLWPGYYTLLPVAGAFLVLSSNNNNTILSGSIIQSIGMWSYSAYLIHWPLIVILKKEGIYIPFVAYFPIVLLLSYILFICVERKRSFGARHIFFFVIVIALSYYVSVNGVNWRVSEKFQLTRQQYRNQNEGHMGIGTSNNVQYFNSNENNFDYILIGNSFARHYFYYIEKEKLKVASLALDGCTSTHNYYSSFNKEMCENRYQMEINFINKHPGKPIIISRHWPGLGRGTYDRINHTNLPYQDFDKLMIGEINQFLADINHTKHNVYLVGATPGSSKVMFECLAQSELPINRVISALKGTECGPKEEYKPLRINELLKQRSAKADNLYYIDTSIPLCKNGMCDVVINGTPVYTDTAHMSKVGSEIVGSYLFDFVKKNEK